MNGCPRIIQLLVGRPVTILETKRSTLYVGRDVRSTTSDRSHEKEKIVLAAMIALGVIIR